VIAGALLLLSASPAGAAATDEYEQSKQAEASISGEAAAPADKVPWRNSIFSYENTFSALTLSKGADLSYNPYYAQSLSFRPRYYVRDDISLRLRLDLEIELTQSDETDTTREWELSDMLIDVNYAPTWMVIPYAKVAVNPDLRFTFPTSIRSRGRSLMMGLAPGVAFRRSFDLLKGNYLKNIGVTYGFRATKYFHEYATAQLAESVCGGLPTDANSPNADTGCLQTGKYNRSWGFTNSLGFQLAVLEKLSVSGTMMFMNYVMHKGAAKEVVINAGMDPITMNETKVNHSAALWFILDVNYDLYDWLSLSAGISTYHPQLDPESDYYAPFFNRFTAFYFDVTIPVDKFVSQVQTWTGWGR